MAHIPGLYLKPESFSPSYGRKKMTDTLGYARRSPPVRAISDYLLTDHQPSAIRGEACLRRLERNNYSKTIRLSHVGYGFRLDRALREQMTQQ